MKVLNGFSVLWSKSALELGISHQKTFTQCVQQATFHSVSLHSDAKLHKPGYPAPPVEPNESKSENRPQSFPQVEKEGIKISLGTEFDQSEVEQILLHFFRKVFDLNTKNIDITTDLKRFGLGSIIVVELCEYLEGRYGIKINPSTVFEISKINEIARHICQEDKIGNVKKLGQNRFSFESPGRGGHDFYNDRDNSSALKKDHMSGKVAIIGVSARFPGCANLDEFWNSLIDKKDLISHIPRQRWDYKKIYGDPEREKNRTNVTWGGFLKDVDSFDAAFFNISPREAELMDPQQRILLEDAWHAIESAGISPSSLSDSNTGVFIGVSGAEYLELMLRQEQKWEGYTATGTDVSIIPNRISYLMGLHGPSMAIDTACSSSLVALHQAVQAIKNGECDMALAGGINLCLTPRRYFQYSHSGMLSRDGRCKTFDSRADGYVRGEGSGVLLLKDLASAIEDKDPVRAAIIGSAINHGGFSNSLTAPNPGAQSELLIKAYESGAVDPRTVNYIEVHGTGTSLGDPIEINGLSKAFASLFRKAGISQPDEPYCYLGSVKTNIGHLEAAAGIAGMIKVLLAMRQKKIPAMRHFDQLNPNVELSGTPFKIAGETIDWKACNVKGPEETTRRAGVSSFGYGGTNAHMILESFEYPKKEILHRPSQQFLFVLSAKTGERLKACARNILDFLISSENDNGEPSLEDTIYTLQVGRDAMEARLAAIVDSRKDLIKKLEGYLVNQADLKDLYYCYSKKERKDYVDADSDINLQIHQTARSLDYRNLARYWVAGFDLKWADLYSNNVPHRIAVPGYPFMAKRYWLPEIGPDSQNKIEENSPSKNHHVQPSVFQMVWGRSNGAALAHKTSRYIDDGLIFISDQSSKENLDRYLKRSTLKWRRTAWVTIGKAFRDEGDCKAEINPNRPEDFERLAQWLKRQELSISNILYFWSAASGKGIDHIENHNQNQEVVSVYRVIKMINTLGCKKPKSLFLVMNEREGWVNPFTEAASAFSKSISWILPYLSIKSIYLSRSMQNPKSVVDVISREVTGKPDETAISEIRYHEGDRYNRHLKSIELPRKKDNPFREKGLYLITGGSGALGLLIADYLAETYQANLVLVGRSTENTALDQRLEGIKAHGTEILYMSADVSNIGDMETVMQEIKSRFRELNGIIHVAGLGFGKLLFAKTEDEFISALAAKTTGTIILDELTKDEALDFFVLFSSTSSFLGDFGQCDYAIANRFLDSYASHRESLHKQNLRQGKSISINWPLWKDGGIHLDKQAESLYLKSSNMSYLENEVGLHLFQRIMEQDHHQIIVSFQPDSRARITSKAGFLASFGQEKNRKIARRRLADSLHMPLKQDVCNIAGRILKIDPDFFDLEDSIAEYGFDSLAMKEFAANLSEFYGIEILPILFFQKTSLNDISEHIMQTFRSEIGNYYQGSIFETAILQAQHQTEGEITTVFKNGSSDSTRAEDEIAIIGMEGIFPGANDLNEFWQLLKSGSNAVGSMPPDRVALLTRSDKNSDLKSKAGGIYGGFIRDIDKFDSAFFQISPNEAKRMDPQQRLFIQVVWNTVENAGYKISDLSQHKIGVFVGVQFSDYQQLLNQHCIDDAQVLTGNAKSIIPNRVSYLFNFRGPSEAVDTACSSSLVAIHRALRSIRSGECDMALAGGVHSIIDQKMFALIDQLGVLSPDGKCMTFDKKANGYVRGEGVGCLLLKPLNLAISDNDHIHAVIKGSAVNHGGKSVSLTAPSQNAHADLIVEAVKDAGISADTLSYIEVHGTGTELGDPIEIDGLKEAITILSKKSNQSESSSQNCALGSVKTNIGHLEPAAGIASVIKVVLAMQNRLIPKTLHVDEINPLIQLNNSPFYIVREAKRWDCQTDKNNQPIPRRAGVSSFGFGGTNAHLILEDYELLSTNISNGESQPQVIVLSAKNNEQLKIRARQLASILSRTETIKEPNDLNCFEDAISLGDIAYTLQTGREVLCERLAFVAEDKNESIEVLTRFINGEASFSGVYRSQEHRTTGTKTTNSNPREEVIANAIRFQNLEKLANLWVLGNEIEWDLLHVKHSPKPRKALLAGYPFARISHWLPETSKQTGGILKTNPNTPNKTMSNPSKKHESFSSNSILEQDLASFKNALKGLKKYARFRLLERLRSMGLFQKLNTSTPLVKVQQEYNIEPGFHRLFRELIKILEDEGWLSFSGETITTTSKLEENETTDYLARLDQVERELRIKYPQIEAHLDFLAKCLSFYPELLRGMKQPIEVLFPGGSLELVERIYHGNPLSDYYNLVLSEQVYQQVVDLLGNNGSKQLKILEVGAGTGGTTQKVLEKLKLYDQQISYVYSDVSEAFVQFGKSKYSGLYPNMEFKRLDIEADMDNTGFDLNSFDLVIATNVLHATKRIDHTLSTVSNLLCEDGVLVINELTYADDYYTLTFGLTKGWWFFEDGELRLDGSPLLSCKTWKVAMESAGFNNVNVHGADKQFKKQMDQSVICGKKGGMSTSFSLGQRGLSADQVKNNIRETIQICMGSILGIDPSIIDSDSSFTKYGVDSIVGMKIVEEINQSLLVKIRASVLFDYNNLKELAEYIQKSHGEELLKKHPGLAAPEAIKARGVEKAIFSSENSGALALNQTGGRNEIGLNRISSTDIAIIGISCMFPGAKNKEAFWENLRENRCFISEVPKDRWNLDDYYSTDLLAKNKTACKWGGFLNQPYSFDPLFFNISPHEAQLMDPQHRLFLESVWNTIEDSGYAAETIAGTDTAVFVGVSNSDYREALLEIQVPSEILTLTGTSHSVLANRVSHFFDFRGPSEAVDTTCSSSVVAIHRAMNAIKYGECDMAIAGGVNLLLTPSLFIEIGDADLLSEDGRVSVFEKQGTGFVRSDGVGAVLLKPLNRAIEDRDHVYGVLKASAVSHGGKAASLTSPKPEAMAALICKTYAAAGIKSEEVGYVEVQGSGTEIGDMLEWDALEIAFSKSRVDKNKKGSPHCGVGSIKPSIGHGEAASGIAALLKILWCLKNKTLLPTFFHGELSPRFVNESSPFFVVRESREWGLNRMPEQSDSVRRASLNSYGLGGTYAHLVVEEFNQPAHATCSIHTSTLEKELFLVSAPTRENLYKQLQNLRTFFKENSDLSLQDAAHTLRIGRTSMECRVAILASNREELLEKMQQLETGNENSDPEVYWSEPTRNEAIRRLFDDELVALMIDQCLEHERIGKLAELWINGFTVDWNKLPRSKARQRISLPTHVFDKKEYRLPLAEPKILAKAGEIRCNLGQITPTKVQEEKPVISKVHRFVSDILNLPQDQIEVDQNLRKYGYDSLTALKLKNRLCLLTDKEFSLKELFSKTTIEDLVNFLDIDPNRDKKQKRTKTGLMSLPPLGERTSHFSASIGQQALWHAYQYAPESYAYNTPVLFRVSRNTDINSLQKAIHKVLDRHEALNSVFELNETGSIQTIILTKHLDFKQKRLDATLQKDCIRRIKEDARLPFDIKKGPLMRIVFYTTQSEDCYLLLNFHHLVIDGISFKILIEDLQRYYNAERAGQPISLKTCQATYSDFVNWQYKLINSPEGERHLQFWLNQLSPGLPDVDILSGAPCKQSIASYKGKNVQISVDENLSQRLLAWVLENRFTVFTVFLGTFMLLLKQKSLQPEIRIGTPVAGRPEARFEDVIGFFLNMVIIKSSVSAEASFVEFLSEIYDRFLSILEHAHYPFFQIQNALRKRAKYKSRHFFHASLYFQNWKKEPLYQSDSFLKEFIREIHQEGESDLVLEVVEEKSRFQLSFKYNPDIYEKKQIENLSSNFLRLLEIAVANPWEKVANLRETSGDTVKEVLNKLNDTQKDYPKGNRVHELFEEQVRLNTESVAVIFQNQQLTYQSLNKQAGRLAEYLKLKGAKRGDRIGILMDRALELPIALMGVFKAGAAYVALDVSYPEERLDYMIDDSGIAMIITQSFVDYQLPKKIKHRIDLDLELPKLNSQLFQSEKKSGLNPEIAPHADEDLDAYVIYTSGSTGKPKGVQIGQRALVNFLWTMAEEPGFNKDDVILAITTICFDISILELFLPLIAGGTVDIASNEMVKDGIKLREKIEEGKASVIQATPSTYRMLLAAGWQQPTPVKILCGGEPLTDDLAEQLLEQGSELWNMFGPTETTIWSSVCKVEAGKPIHIGYPIANTQFYVLDENLRHIELGEEGELFIGGDGVAKGYLNRPDLNRKCFLSDPFLTSRNNRIYRTGDLVSLLPNGTIRYISRTDNQTKLRGHRIEIGEIEATLEKLDFIRQAICVVKENKTGQKSLIMYITLNEDKAGDIKETCLQHMKQWLPDYMIPTDIVSLSSFPLTLNRKVDRKFLKEQESIKILREYEFQSDKETHLTELESYMESHALYRDTFQEPVFQQSPDELLENILQLISGIFGINSDEIAESMDLNTLGFDSIVATNLRYEIEKSFYIRMSISDLAKMKKIKDLSDYITGRLIDLRHLNQIDEVQCSEITLDQAETDYAEHLVKEIMMNEKNLASMSEEELNHIFDAIQSQVEIGNM